MSNNVDAFSLSTSSFDTMKYEIVGLGLVRSSEQ